MEKNRKLPSKGGLMLSQVLLLSVLFSCSKNDLQEPLSTSGSPSAAISTSSEIGNVSALSANLLYHETFEGSTPFAGLNTQFETSYAFTVATSPVFQGSKSGRFELRDTDPENNNGTRAEVVFPVATNLNRWYSFAVYFPSADFKYDAGDELIGQWKQGESGTSSAISLRIKEDRFRLTVIPYYMATSEKIDLGTVTKDKWLTFAIHVKHSTSSDGLIELWLDGKKIVNRTGSNMYKLDSQDGMTNPKWKLGIYKSAWNGTQTTSTSKRVLFYDDIRLGNENATLAEMTPVANGSTTPTTTDPTSPTAPATQSPVTSFTLVSAHTEKDIQTITDGATINLSTIDVPKLNIRANTSGTVGSVKFELSGTQTKTYIDNNLPFSLNGDDGVSNYYFGNWNPPASGKYTLKATPYSGANATGTAGTPYTISFTFATSTSTGTTTEPVTQSPVTSFTLVSAHTEQDIQTIANGTTIRLSTIDVDKLNIRANTSGTFGSVKFELSGTQTKTFIDSNLPFSLHGDDGGSNYYFGNWGPPALGTYTLKATPYSGASGSGTAGVSNTISFTFVN